MYAYLPVQRVLTVFHRTLIHLLLACPGAWTFLLACFFSLRAAVYAKAWLDADPEFPWPVNVVWEAQVGIYVTALLCPLLIINYIHPILIRIGGHRSERPVPTSAPSAAIPSSWNADHPPGASSRCDHCGHL